MRLIDFDFKDLVGKKVRWITNHREVVTTIIRSTKTFVVINSKNQAKFNIKTQRESGINWNDRCNWGLISCIELISDEQAQKILEDQITEALRIRLTNEITAKLNSGVSIDKLNQIRKILL